MTNSEANLKVITVRLNSTEIKLLRALRGSMWSHLKIGVTRSELIRIGIRLTAKHFGPPLRNKDRWKDKDYYAFMVKWKNRGALE